MAFDLDDEELEYTRKLNKKYINPNILDEGNEMEVIKENEDPMKTLVRCNNCGQVTELGQTRMCSGFVGCDNKVIIEGEEVECYFGDLMPRIVDAHEHNYKKYHNGKFYRYRDNLGFDKKEV